MERLRTGIKGFDELVGGGIPRGRSVLVAGGCGTGKSTFCMQALYNGAKYFDEPGVYVTLDEKPDVLREDCLNFGWDLRELEENFLLRIIDGTAARIGKASQEHAFLATAGLDVDILLKEISKHIDELRARRVVIDSLASLGYSIEPPNKTTVRRAILKMADLLQTKGVTSFMISEITGEPNTYSSYGVEEFIVDGVVVLDYMAVGRESTRTLYIRKMRGTKHSERLHPIEIREGEGIVVLQ